MPTKLTKLNHSKPHESCESSNEFEESEDGIDITEYIIQYKHDPELLRAILLSLNQK
jgi:hypothetical protein